MNPDQFPTVTTDTAARSPTDATKAANTIRCPTTHRMNSSASCSTTGSTPTATG